MLGKARFDFGKKLSVFSTHGHGAILVYRAWPYEQSPKVPSPESSIWTLVKIGKVVSKETQWKIARVYKCMGMAATLMTERDQIFIAPNQGGSIRMKFDKNKQTNWPRFAHLSKTDTAYLQMPCRILPVLPQQLGHKIDRAVKKVEGHSRIIIWTNHMVDVEFPMLHTKIQAQRFLGSREEDFFTIYEYGGHLI